MTLSLKNFEEKIGYQFSDEALLKCALTHKSCESVKEHNERLEFLGDAVLDLIIAETLYHQHSDLDEGKLDHMRATLVNGKSLASLSRKLEIERYLLVSESQQQHRPEHSSAMLEDALEALIGAIYLDGGFVATKSFVLRLFQAPIETVSETIAHANPKGRLQEWLQKKHSGATPEYTLLNESGPDHARAFEVAVEFDGKELGRGQGSSKKSAETVAAEQALKALGC